MKEVKATIYGFIEFLPPLFLIFMFISCHQQGVRNEELKEMNRNLESIERKF